MQVDDVADAPRVERDSNNQIAATLCPTSEQEPLLTITEFFSGLTEFLISCVDNLISNFDLGFDCLANLGAHVYVPFLIAFRLLYHSDLKGNSKESLHDRFFLFFKEFPARSAFFRKRMLVEIFNQRTDALIDIFEAEEPHAAQLIRDAPLYEADRDHDGRVAVGAPNKRWCSDGLEFRCNNRQKVTMTFVLDCCDREIISFAARTGRGLPSWMVQKALTNAVERRFGSEDHVPKGLQFLTDNGSAYVSAATKFLLRCLGIEDCKTAVCSPQSNGMAESLVKTLKRDYLPFIDLSNAESAMSGLAAVVAKYNAWHPHSALGYMSPKEYRKLKGEKEFENRGTVSTIVNVPGYLINTPDSLGYTV